MTFFQKREEQQTRHFQEPLNLDETEFEVIPADAEGWAEPLDPAERRERRADRIRLAAGVGDLLGVVTGTLAVLALLAVILSLASWVQQDVTQMALMLGTGL